MLLTVIIPLNASYAMQQAEPPDFPPTGNLTSCTISNYQSTACNIAKDLILLSPDRIRDYGLNDYDGKTIEQALKLLDPGNLTKVLQNIPPEDFAQIKDKVSSLTGEIMELQNDTK
jgi:hypothetical protein